MILDRDKGIEARNDGQARDFHSDARVAGYLDFNLGGRVRGSKPRLRV